jgi:hypothetical protein
MLYDSDRSDEPTYQILLLVTSYNETHTPHRKPYWYNMIPRFLRGYRATKTSQQGKGLDTTMRQPTAG